MKADVLDKYQLVLSSDDIVDMGIAFEADPEAAVTWSIVAWIMCGIDGASAGVHPQWFEGEKKLWPDVPKVTTTLDNGMLTLRWGRLQAIPATVAPEPAPAPRLAAVEPPPPAPAPEPVPLRPAPPQRVPGLPRAYPQNLVGQLIHAAGVQIDPLVPLYWHRKEHQLEAVDLVNRSGLSSDALVARIRAAKDRPELRRISQLADLIGGRRG